MSGRNTKKRTASAASQSVAETPVQGKKGRTSARKGPTVREMEEASTPDFSTPEPANLTALTAETQVPEVDNLSTAAEVPTQPQASPQADLSQTALLASAQTLAAELHTVGILVKDKARAKKIIEDLEEVLKSLGTSLGKVSVSGWTMKEFLDAEGEKAVAYLDRTRFATDEQTDLSIALNFEAGNYRWVCIACFKGGYRPASCVFKNFVGFLGHRKKGVGKSTMVADPCLAPASVKEPEPTSISNQPIISQGNIEGLYTKFSVPVDKDKDQSCIVHLEPEKILPSEVVLQYKTDLMKYKAATAGLTKAEKAKVPKVKKLACSKWRVCDYFESTKRMFDFNIHQHIADKIALTEARVAADKAAGKSPPTLAELKAQEKNADSDSEDGEDL